MNKKQAKQLALVYRASQMHQDELLRFDELNPSDRGRVQDALDELITADLKRAGCSKTYNDVSDLLRDFFENTDAQPGKD